MTLSSSAALSILIPINLEYHDSVAGRSKSISSVDIQSDEESDYEIGEKELDRHFSATPIRVGAVIRPQFSCPDFSLGTVRGMKGRLKETPPVPTIPCIRRSEDPRETDTNPKGRVKLRKKNSFVQLDPVKLGWDKPLGDEGMPPRKTNEIGLRCSHGKTLEPPDPHRHSHLLTSFDELFKSNLPSPHECPIKDIRDSSDDSPRRIAQGTESGVLPNAQVNPVKSGPISLDDSARVLMRQERPNKRRTKWLEKIVGKKKTFDI